MLENFPDFMSADVYVTPPDEQDISEEDSDDEDQPVRVSLTLNYLSRQQLSAEADAKIVRCTRRSAGLYATVVTTIESNGTSDEADDDEVTPAELCAESLIKKRSKAKSGVYEIVRKWKKEDLKSDTGCVPVLHENPLFVQPDMTPVDFFSYSLMQM